MRNCVIGANVVVEEGAVVDGSIVMKGTRVGAGAQIDHAIIAEDVVIGERAKIGFGEMAESKYNKKVYAFELATIGEHTVIPPDVTIGKNTAIKGRTTIEDYPGGVLESGGAIIHDGGVEEGVYA